MEKVKAKLQKKQRRHARVRAKIAGTAARPRLVVYKSNRCVGAQLVDDERGVSLGQVRSLNLAEARGKPLREAGRLVGARLAAQAKEKGIEKVVFDRAGYRYTGVVREVAEGARAGGLAF